MSVAVGTHGRRRIMSEKKSSTGLESNIAGLLSYLVGWITGLIFFLIEQEDEFVRFHAMQSIIVEDVARPPLLTLKPITLF